MFPKDASRPSIGVIAAGGIGYEYEGRVLDLMGVNDAKMAHATRARYGLHGHSAVRFYEESPHLVIASGEECALDRPEVRLIDDWLGTLVGGIALEPRFRTVYAPVSLSYPDWARAGLGLCEWAKKSLIENVSSEVLIQPIARNR